MKIVVVSLILILSLGCGHLSDKVTEYKYKDCSDLVRENSKLKDDLKLMKKAYKQQKDTFEFFKMHMWNQVDKHNATCTHPKIGLISK